jgi:hypothetical protein
MALGTGWASAAPTAAGTDSTRSFFSPAQTPDQSWCDFLAWLYGRDVCGRDNGGGGDNGNGGGPGNGNGGWGGGGWGNGPGGPPTTVAPAPTDPTVPPVTAAPAVPEVPSATLPPPTVPPAPPPTAAPPTAPPAPPPPPAPAAAAEQAPPPTRSPAPATSPTTAAATVPPTAPPTAPPTTLPRRIGGLAVPELPAPRAVEASRDVLPEPRREDRSLIRSVIDTTSGPIGRRVVALAGVLLAVVIGILAATIDDRTQLVRRIQESRHVDEH